MTLREALKFGQEKLAEASVPDAAYDAEILALEATGLSRAEYWLNNGSQMDTHWIDVYTAFITERAEHIPLQYILGRQEFMGLTFKVNGSVLIPRQDTEILAEEALKLCKGKRVLDLCTGSGCLAVSIAKLGDAAYVLGTDISAEALSVAQENAAANGAEADFLLSDMFKDIEGEFDVIVSNPPYIASDECGKLMPEVRTYEPSLALDGGRDGLDFYRAIAAEAGSHLSSEGILLLEIGCSQGKDVCKILEENHFSQCTIIKDLAGLNRVVRTLWKG